MLTRPASEILDLLALDLRRRADRSRATDEVGGGHLTRTVHESVEKAELDDRLDLGAREPIRTPRQ
jgi:hypothetical protein